MTVNNYQVSDYEELLTALRKLSEDNIPIYILFNKVEKEEKNEEQPKIVKKILFGDELKAENVDNVIEDYLTFLPDRRTINLIRIYLTPEMWVPGSMLYQDPYLRILKIPTLIRWKGPQRLEMEEVVKLPLLSLLFEEDQEKENKEDFSELYKKIDNVSFTVT